MIGTDSVFHGAGTVRHMSRNVVPKMQFVFA